MEQKTKTKAVLNIKQLKIWQKGLDIAANVFRLVTFSSKENNLFLLCNQPGLRFQFIQISRKDSAEAVIKTIEDFRQFPLVRPLRWKHIY